MGAKAVSVCFADFNSEETITTPPSMPSLGSVSRWMVGTCPRSTPSGSVPDTGRWIVVGLWTDVDDAVASLDLIDEIAPWLNDATTQWRMAGVPIRTTGTSNHTADGSVATPWDLSSEPLGDGPVLSWTTAGYSHPDDFRSARAQLFLSNAAQLRLHVVPKAPGLLGYRSLVPFPGTLSDGINITLWSSLSAMTEYAYSPGEHRKYMDQHHLSPTGWFDRSSFTRFKPLRMEGTLTAWP